MVYLPSRISRYISGVNLTARTKQKSKQSVLHERATILLEPDTGIPEEAFRGQAATRSRKGCENIPVTGRANPGMARLPDILEGALCYLSQGILVSFMRNIQGVGPEIRRSSVE